jgi:hypothetical protein
VARVERVDVRVELANQEEDMVYGVSFVDLLPRVKRATSEEEREKSPCERRTLALRAKILDFGVLKVNLIPRATRFHIPQTPITCHTPIPTPWNQESQQTQPRKRTNEIKLPAPRSSGVSSERFNFSCLVW